MLDEHVRLVGDPIRAPDKPPHLMWVKPFARSLTISRKGEKLAQTINPLRVTELGRDLYGPIIYIPRADVVATLEKNQERTFCPLKGHASYFTLIGPGGTAVAQDIAWAYEDVLERAEVLRDHIAFDANLVEIEDGPIW